jgi:NYN domain/OST-HTH/LOTUS domain
MPDRQASVAAHAESVALYWDFENLHAGLVDQADGPGSYLANRFRPQDALIDVAGIVEFALSMGPIAINRAFANWLSFARYRQPLLQSAVELIQVFPPGANAKNGADIKLCLDVMDDMSRFAHIGTFIVVGGDSDYMPLSYKVKAAGRTLVGIGGRRSTNPHWARSCHEFKYYETLVAPVTRAAAGLPADDSVPVPLISAALPPVAVACGATGALADGVPEGVGERPAPDAAQPEAGASNPYAPGMDTDELRQLLDQAVAQQHRAGEARELVAKAMVRLGQMRGDPWIQKARLRPYLQRMDPTFHESNFGFASFNELLASMGDLIETRRGEFDHELRLAERPGLPVNAP